MTVAIMRTRAEDALAESFEQVAGRLPGGAAVRAARRSAIEALKASGLPHRRIEEWRYTDLRAQVREALRPAAGDRTAVTAAEIDAALGPLAAVDADRVVIVNGSHRAELSRLSPGAGVEVRALAGALEAAQDKVGERLAGVGPAGDTLVALNTAFMSDGAVVRVADTVAVERPLLLVFARAGSEPLRTTTRTLVAVGRKARITLVEAHVTLGGGDGAKVAPAQASTLTDVVVGDEAHVEHVKLAAARDMHLSSTQAALGVKSTYRGFQLTLDTPLARNEIAITFGGAHAALELSGAFLARGSEHVDTTLTVDHAVPHCQSRELFKGVLDGAARGIFQGKIIVRPDAQKTDGKQMAQALMLSPDAEFDSKPELEIYADDVVCGHGSTAAEIDEDLVFYCRSRGIPKAEARALIVQSFIGEAIDRIEHEGVRAALSEIAVAWLKRGG